MDDQIKNKLNDVIVRFLKDIIRIADNENYDRNSFVKASADMVLTMAEISTFEHFRLEQTNADLIRAMNDEELSEFLWGFDKEEISREKDTVFLLRKNITRWLQQSAKEVA